MRRLFYILIFLIPVGRLMTGSLFESATKVAALTPDQFILCFIVIAFLTTPSTRKLLSQRKMFGVTPILVFTLWSLFSLLLGKFRFGLSVGQMAFSGLYLARWIAYSLLFFVAYAMCNSGLEVKRIVKWLTIGGAVFAAFGLFQAAFLPDFAFILHPEAVPLVDFDPQGHRLVSTFLDPNIAAGYILIFALLALSFWIHGYPKWLGVFLLFGCALFATLSRGGVLGFVVGSLVLVTGKKFPWKRALWGMFVCAVIVYFMYPTLAGLIQERNRLALSDPSALSRIQDWAVALEIVVSNPFAGIGFDTLGYILPRFGIIRESATAFAISGDLITICVLTGIIGLTLYLWMFVDILRGFSRLRHGTTSTWVRAYAGGVQAATIGVFVSSFFTTLLLYPQIMAVLWILWALGARMEDGVAAQSAQEVPTLVHAPA